MLAYKGNQLGLRVYFNYFGELRSGIITKVFTVSTEKGIGFGILPDGEKQEYGLEDKFVFDTFIAARDNLIRLKEEELVKLRKQKKVAPVVSIEAKEEAAEKAQ